MGSDAKINDRAFLKYSRVAVFLHWVIAILILSNIVLGYFASSFREDLVRFAIDTHKSAGITILGLVIMRLLWRFRHRPPAFSVRLSAWERRAAHVVHGALYLLMLAIPISGWMHDSAWKAAADVPMRIFGLFPWPRIPWIMEIEPVLKERLHGILGAVHAVLAYLLVALFLVHVLAALKHQLVDGEPELERMLP